ncbi:MAG: sodium:proton antiporter [Flavobacteriales bacterium]|nr:sodium:proton antiporter [Flavobacteriales bacterium]
MKVFLVKSKICLLLLILFIGFNFQSFSVESTQEAVISKHIETIESIQDLGGHEGEKEMQENFNLDKKEQQVEEHAEHVGEHSKAHETDTSALLFIILAIIIGVSTRHFVKRSPFPFTVLLLIIGLILGVINRLGFFVSYSIFDFNLEFAAISESIDFAAHMDPHMLLFIFLPILIFEASYAMDLHTFKKTSTNAILLAVPGILLALGLTAVLAMGLKYAGIGLGTWNWSLALMFGAIVSATDPVAVVALLKELGASKKLGTLIEGESLLNDGTAIVLFMVFFLGITGDADGGSPVLEFFRVVFGGLFIGGLFGFIVLRWIKNVFNDALVETSLVIAAAYLTFYVAEHTFHVSGVLGLVALGLIIGGVGRSRISPQVEHFMHEFWELAGFIANCLIFLIVGIVVAERSVFNFNDFLLLGVFYIGIHVIRAIVIFVLYPLMNRSGYGLPKKEAIVVWFGALRGAIGLALALIVAGVDDQYISKEIKDQFLFFTAGIVTLTLLINASTIKYLVEYLGLTKVSPAKAQMLTNARDYLYESTKKQIERLKTDRFIKKSDWDAVHEYLPNSASQIETEGVAATENIAELRKRFLEAEKSSYWHQFRDGLLGAEGVKILSDNISHLLDVGGKEGLDERKDLEESWRIPPILNRISTWPIIGKIAKTWYLDQMSLSYDCAVSFIMAQEDALRLVESMSISGKEDKNALDILENEINGNRIEGQTFLRNLRKNYPGVYKAVSTTQAIRSMLNYEAKTIERLQKRGRIDSGEAARMMREISNRSKLLQKNPPPIETESLAKGIS